MVGVGYLDPGLIVYYLGGSLVGAMSMKYECCTFSIAGCISHHWPNQVGYILPMQTNESLEI